MKNTHLTLDVRVGKRELHINRESKIIAPLLAGVLILVAGILTLVAAVFEVLLALASIPVLMCSALILGASLVAEKIGLR